MAKITNEIVEEVKKYASKYPDMTQNDMAKLVGISPASVSNILNGAYKEEEEKVVESQIPHETYRRLVMCEEAVKEIFKNMKTAFDEEDDLFIDYHTINAILKRCLPEEYEQSKKNLKSEVNENGSKKLRNYYQGFSR